MPLSNTPLRTLIVEDSDSDSMLIVRHLQKSGFEVLHERVESVKQIQTALENQEWDIVLSDFNLPGFSAGEVLSLLHEKGLDIPFIIISGNMDEDVAIALMRAGASDYLLKNNLERLASAIRRELENVRVRKARGLAEAAHYESALRFKQLFNMAPVPLCHLDKAGNILDINARFEQVLGYSHADVPTINEWWELAYPDPEYRHWVILNWNAAVSEAVDKQSDIHPSEYQVTCKNGEVRTLLISGIIFGDSLLLASFDLTERKQALAELNHNLVELERARSALLGVLEDQHETQAALRESEAKYRLLFSANPVPMWVYDLNTLSFLAVNDAAIEHYGYSREEFLGMAITDIRPESDVPKRIQNVRMAASSVNYHNEAGLWRHRKKDGSLIWVEITGHTLEFESKHAEIILAHDVTARITAEQQLRLNAQVFESSQEGIVITDAKNNILSVNPAFTAITGYTTEEVVGRNPKMLSSGIQDKAFYEAMWQQIFKEDRWQGEILNRRKNGELYPEWISICTIRDPEGRISHYIGIQRDLTEHKAAEERIQFLSNFDPLTHMPNRSLLRDRTQLAVSSARRIHGYLALIYLDIDRFKIVNDSLGPATGDYLIKEMSERLAKSLHQDDTLSRPGGDEFILLLPNTNAEGAAHVGQKLLELVAQPFTFDGQRITLTASIGIAEYPQDGKDFDELSQSADAALFRAKQNGRNNFQFFTRQLHEQAREVLQVENDLRKALEQDEFVLYYQPQVDAKTSRIIGAEALIRWLHPLKGMVPPGRFIPIAEESDLIIAIGEWVLHSAIGQVAAWQISGLPIVPVAVNLSVAQFRQDTLYQSVVQALRISKLDPAMLELEMTEGIAMENSERTIGMLDQLHSLGVSLSIDDFGTGYSSLSYLKRFRIDKLKIDQSFVRDLGHDPEDEAIVTAIIGMAKSLGFKTIAEGVETREQLDFLRNKQCDEIQGYYFCKPIPAEEFAEMLHNGTVFS